MQSIFDNNRTIIDNYCSSIGILTTTKLWKDLDALNVTAPADTMLSSACLK